MLGCFWGEPLAQDRCAGGGAEATYSLALGASARFHLIIPKSLRSMRYGRVDPCPGVGCTSNLVPKSATSDGDKAKVPVVPVAVFGAIPLQ